MTVSGVAVLAILDVRLIHQTFRFAEAAWRIRDFKPKASIVNLMFDRWRLGRHAGRARAGLEARARPGRHGEIDGDASKRDLPLGAPAHVS